MARIASLVFVALLAAPGAAAGAVAPVAPEYASSEPADGAELHQAPDTVTATFSEPLDPGSEMSVEDSCGNQIDDGNVEVSLTEMSVGIASKPSGRYHVAYVARGLAGATGSNEGHFTFTVHAGPDCKGGPGGHGNHDPGGKGGHGNHDPGGNDHSSHDPGGDGQQHSGTHGADGDHSGDHTGGSMTHSDHDPAAGGGDRNAHASHGGRSSSNEVGDLAGIAAGQTPLPDLSPDSATVLLALLMCAAFGALGGWVLRVSAQR